MPTLQELVMEDVLGSAGTKTASVKTAAAAPAVADEAGLDKIAMELGLFGDSTPAAVATEKTAGQTTSEVLAAAAAAQAGAATSTEKTAGSFGDLYGSFFPDDALGTVGGEEKTAEAEKVAAEEALGALTWDKFSERFDARIEKLAYAALAGSAHKGDVEAPNHIPNDKSKRDAGGGAIDTTPQVRDEIKNMSPEGGVGHYEQRHADTKTAAVRKQFLLAQLTQ